MLLIRLCWSLLLVSEGPKKPSVCESWSESDETGEASSYGILPLKGVVFLVGTDDIEEVFSLLLKADCFRFGTRVEADVDATG